MDPADFLTDMALVDSREKTFEKWPFKRGSCTAKEMAKAGFFTSHKDNHETVTCYYCFKELEGWESTDIPFQEHKKHAPYCCFIKKYSKAPESVTAREIFELECGRFIRIQELETAKILAEFDEVSSTIQSIVTTSDKPKKQTLRRRKK